MNKLLKHKLAQVKLIISDVDGVLTDGAVYKNDGGDEFKKFSVTDGSGMAMARSANLHIALVSGRYSKVTEIRAKELHIKDLYNGILDKIEPYLELKRKYNLTDEEIAFIGDDIIDLPVMRIIGAPIAVENAIDSVKNVAIYTTTKSGGDGALRETIDLILYSQDRYDEILRIVEEKIFVNRNK